MLRSILTVKQAVVPVALLFSTLALAQFRTVTVQNAASNPVPTTIQNTPQVTVSGTVDTNITNTVNATIANTPTVTVAGPVSAAITNTPTVNLGGPVMVSSGTVNATITNTPTVNLGSPVSVSSGTVNATITNTPTVLLGNAVPVTGSVSLTGTSDVSVTNLPLGTAGPLNTTVVLVKNLDSTITQPLQVPFTCTTGVNGNCTSAFTVPPGKVFVAEYLQTSSLEPPAVNTLYYRLQTTSGGQTVNYFYDPGAQIVGQNIKMRTGDHMVRIYADAGSTIFLSGFADVNGNPNGLNISMTLSGHLVNAQ